MAEQTPLHDVLISAEGLPAGVATVRAFSGTEGLSAGYAFEVTLTLRDADIEPRALLFKGAQVTVIRASDTTVVRRYAGIVMRLVERASRSTVQEIRLTIEPPVSLLRLYRDRRIFQKMKTDEIVKTILADRGIDEKTVAFRLSGSYASREVSTQFDETDFDYVARLLEEEGIFTFTEHGENGPIYVFGDSASAYATGVPSKLPFRAASGMASDEAILHITSRASAQPGKVTLRDHDFKRPALSLEATEEIEAPFGREHYDYPGYYVEPAEGSRRAKVRLEGFRAVAAGARAETSAFSPTPGHTFTIEGAPDDALDREWVVRAAKFSWQREGAGVRFSNEIDLLASDIPFRPPMKTPRPAAPGPLVASVTGPAGEEVHTDEFGRIKVGFPWDRRCSKDDKSSCWIRVGQMHTSGSVVIPRIGWEVLVDFENGDLDRPIALGRLYNGLFPPPYSLPAEKTKSSLGSTSSPGGGGHNEIRMDDGSGGEHVAMHSQKDMNLAIASNKTEKIAVNANLGVGADHTVTVGGSETTKVGAAHNLTVGGSQSHTVGGSRTKTIGGTEKTEIGGSRSTIIGGSHTTITPEEFSESTPAAFAETIGGTVLQAAAGSVTAAVAGVTTVSVSGAMIAVCGEGRSEFTLGAQATTVGGAMIAGAGEDVSLTVKGAKATTVGGAYGAEAGGDVTIASKAKVAITVGGAVSFNAGKIVFKVGGSNVTIGSGAVVIKSPTIKLTATGSFPELAGMVEDK